MNQMNDSIHVWVTELNHDTSSLIPLQYLDILDEEERDTFHRFKFDRDRQLFLMAHALLRSALSCFADVSPGDWQFHRNAFGKPEIANADYTWLRFNLSHTPGLVACVIAKELDVGIDVEAIDRLGDLESLGRSVLTLNEFHHFMSLSGQNRQAYFLERWTLKESFVKAMGKGLYIPVDQISFECRNQENIHIVFEDGFTEGKDGWQFQLHKPTGNHLMAVAVRTQDKKEIRIRKSAPLMDDVR